jgi:hypothetical protein
MIWFILGCFVRTPFAGSIGFPPLNSLIHKQPSVSASRHEHSLASARVRSGTLI